ncbi:MAG: hypothetical protein WC668_03810 [Patescibacteria group bacterium]|jgi:hypothetical protein
MPEKKSEGRWFDVSQGPSKLPWQEVSVMYGSEGDETCGLCGTYWKDDCHHFNFLGMNVVMECCGAVVDRLYREWGNRFTGLKLHQFAHSPTNRDFILLRGDLNDALCEAAAVASKVITDINQAQGRMEAIRSVMDFAQSHDNPVLR